MILNQLKKFVSGLAKSGAQTRPLLRVRYVGLHPGFKGNGAYAKFDDKGNMFVQVDGQLVKGQPQCIVNGTNYSIGWHRVRKSDWLLESK